VSKTKELNVGIVGYGFMGRTHSNAWLQAPRYFNLAYRPVLKAISARNVDRVRTFAENWGYQSVESDWRALIARSDIDLSDHRLRKKMDEEMIAAIASVKAGK